MPNRHSLFLASTPPWLFAIVIVSLLLPLGGLRFRFFALEWLNVVVTSIWLIASVSGTAFLRPPRLAGGVTIIAGAFYVAFSIEGPAIALAMSVVTLVAGGLMARHNRTDGGKWLVVVGQIIVGLTLGVIGVLVEWPGESALGTSAIPGVVMDLTFDNLGTWMVPGVILGVPMINAVFLIWHWLKRSFRIDSTDEVPLLLEHLATEWGWPAERTRNWIWFGGVLFGVVAVAMSRLMPLITHLLLAVLGLAAAVALNFRRVRQEGIGAIMVYGYSFVTILFFVASLKYRFLNRLFPGAMPGNIGWDFFQIPRAFDYLIHGVTFYHKRPEIYQSTYAPYATEPTALYPLQAILPGGLIFILPPFVAYWAFVAFSLIALFMLYRWFSSFASTPLRRSLIALSLFVSWPNYLMLWMGQAHIFPVIGYGLVSLSLLCALAGADCRWKALFVVGFLSSLFSKPLLFLLWPVAFVARSTRRSAVAVLLIYVTVSALFVVVPFLNPGQIPLGEWLARRVSFREFVNSANMYHWSYILYRGDWLATNWREVFSLPTILHVVIPGDMALSVSKLLMLALILYLLWVMGKTSDLKWGYYLLSLAALLVNAAYFLGYALVFEYQYSTLIFVPIVLLLLMQHTEDKRLRRLLWVGLVFYLPYLLPSAYGLVVPNPVPDVYWDFSGETLAQMTLYRTSRVLPAILIVIVLILAMRRARQIADSGTPLWPTSAIIG